MEKSSTLVPITETDNEGAKKYLAKMAANIKDKMDFLEKHLKKMMYL